MPENQGKPTRFWQELKRRKVFGVVTTYAATAYIIIEVINNLIGPFHLPQWMPTLVALLLVVGLPIVVILSWIFDFTPQGIKKTESVEESLHKEISEKKAVKRKLRPSYILNAVLIITVIILAWPKIFKPDIIKRLRSSGERIAVAVMPFQNLTNDTTWNVWQDGIQQSLISSLSNSGELKVRQKESISMLLPTKGHAEYAAISPTVAGTISRKLDADIFIYGNMQKAGSTIRINAQLIDTKTNEVLKSIEITQPYRQEIIIDLTDSLRKKVTDFLLISKLIKEYPIYQAAPLTTSFPEALRYCIYGDKANYNFDGSTARTWYLKALAIDSNYFDARIGLCSTGTQDQNIQGILSLYKKKDQMPVVQQIYTEYMYARNFESWEEQIKWLNQYLQFDDKTPLTFYSLGFAYDKLQQYDKAISMFRKSIDLCQKFGSKDFLGYAALGETYHKMGQFKAEKKVYKEAERKISDHSHGSFSWIIRDQAILSLAEKDSVAANRYIEKYIAIIKENSFSDTDIAGALAGIYSDAGILDKAEKYYRKALSFEPEDPGLLDEFAWFLARNKGNPDEFNSIIDKALKLALTKWDYYNYLDTKGYGLYKLGKNQEALEVLQKTWDSAEFKMYFIKSHLDDVKKAIAAQTSN